MTGILETLSANLLTALIFFPLAGALLLVFLPRDDNRLLRNVTFGVTLAEFLLSLPLVLDFNGATAAMQFVVRAPWIPAYGIEYHVGVDGISLWLVMLTTFLMPIAILSTYSAVEKHVKEFMIFMLVLEVGMVGVFLAVDLFLFYVFWELVLIPMYFLIGVWGSERRIYSAIKFFLFTFAGSVLMLVAIIVLKMGTYGILRFAMPLFPVAAVDLMPVISGLAVIGIIYGALVAMVQKDMKKVVAYSSVSHLGFVMLGLFAFNLQGIEGGILQMINHGVSTGALFLIVGIVYERRHTRLIEEFGGLSKVAPLFAAVFMIVTLSSIGLPGTNGFVCEFLILLGAFKTTRLLTVFAASGVILAAVYMLWMYQRVMFGKITNEENRHMTDLNAREVAYLLPILVMIFWIGVYPQTFLRKMDASVSAVVTQIETKRQAALSGRPAGGPLLARYFDVGK